jgi:hypothetical protein
VLVNTARSDSENLRSLEIVLHELRNRTACGKVEVAAPAGVVAAAAPEGGALAGPSVSPHLPVVGAGNPVAVLGLAR